MSIRRACSASNLIFLAKLHDPKQRKRILAAANPDQIKFIRNICHNIAYNKSFKLNKTEKQKLVPYKNVIRALGSTKTPPSTARKHLIQKGGFLPLLLPIATAVLGSLASRLVQKAIPI